MRSANVEGRVSVRTEAVQSKLNSGPTRETGLRCRPGVLGLTSDLLSRREDA